MTETLTFEQILNEKIPTKLGVALRTEKSTVIATVEAKNLVKLLTFLRDDEAIRFEQLVTICGADYPEREKRFEIIYQLLSLKHNRRMMVKVNVAEGGEVPTACGVYNSANWFERETFDLYGVLFTDHPDMRRILTDYGFEGHPLRKDFPLTGFLEVRYDDKKKKVVYEKVNLPQEFRSFDFEMPWEGTQYAIPTPADAKPAEKKA
jgi:NADH-quinone oxidoreductase subunit C